MGNASLVNHRWCIQGWARHGWGRDALTGYFWVRRDQADVGGLYMAGLNASELSAAGRDVAGLCMPELGPHQKEYCLHVLFVCVMLFILY